MDFRRSSTVAIIGAGPYGLSVAAHLSAAGIDFRIFGKPLHRWQHEMPKGMFLKSDGGASSLSDPAGRYTLERYCSEHGLPYSQKGLPVPLDTFVQYATSFQRKLVPHVEEVMVKRVERAKNGFELHLADGSIAAAENVIVATGLDYAVNLPQELTALPSRLLSHSADNVDPTRFRGRDVIVIGAGQSALEGAALLYEAGATVRVLVRQRALVWNDAPPADRSLAARIRYPDSNLGEGLALWAYCTFPSLFRYLPRRLRLEKVRTELGPAGAWWLKNRITERVRIQLESTVVRAEEKEGRALLQVRGGDGKVTCLTADHVVAATGYRFQLSRLNFLSESLLRLVRTEEQLPVVSAGFESSIPGLYFTGIASMNFFGPAMRFIAGTDHTARRITGHIRQTHNNTVPSALRYADRPAETTLK